jgi:glycosyltransferase involved in cell wall biosynthesis
MKNNLAVLIPTYNEAQNIALLLEKIKSCISRLSLLRVVIYVIDDSSPDGTARVVEQIKASLETENFRIQLLHRAQKQGLGKAYIDGFKTLLWDIDPQGSTTFYYKVKPKGVSGIKKLISKDAKLESAIMATDYENLEIIPADASAKSFDIMVEEMKGNKTRLKSILKQLEDEYDFVFIDCPPGFSALSENIFSAADVVLMPIIPTTLSVRTYNMIKDYFKEKDLDSSKMMEGDTCLYCSIFCVICNYNLLNSFFFLV